jgi:hypothetical protein
MNPSFWVIHCLGFVFDSSQPTGCYSPTVSSIDKANLPKLQ